MPATVRTLSSALHREAKLSDRALTILREEYDCFYRPMEKARAAGPMRATQKIRRVLIDGGYLGRGALPKRRG